MDCGLAGVSGGELIAWDLLPKKLLPAREEAANDPERNGKDDQPEPRADQSRKEISRPIHGRILALFPLEFKLTPERWTACKIRLLDLAEITDAWRLFPRLILTGYGYLSWELAKWVMAKPDVSASQSAFATAVIGLAVPLASFYFNSGRPWQGQLPK